MVARWDKEGTPRIKALQQEIQSMFKVELVLWWHIRNSCETPLNALG